ncbi:MAG: adenine nucleotide alpha hydrolase [Calditrichaeota bacterium]|nr:MAG: adenine nucleotide alpha hydrolase [Calditrichota bacterium]
MKIHNHSSYEVIALLTTITQGYDRISIHGVRRELLIQQARALGIPLQTVMIPPDATNEIYESCMREALKEFKKQGICKVAFGDLFLADIRAYRERLLSQIGMEALFPIWQRDTRELVETFISLGFKSILVCVDLKRLPSSFAGRIIDNKFLHDLPREVDPCGENGEFHTFVFDGPVFKKKIDFVAGELVVKNDCCFCDLQSLGLWR